MNRFTYLYQNGYYWSMSPFALDANNTAADGLYQHQSGNANGTWINSSHGLRPVSKCKY